MQMQPGMVPDRTSSSSSAMAGERSVLELTSMEDFLVTAELANRQFVSERGVPTSAVSSDDDDFFRQPAASTASTSVVHGNNNFNHVVVDSSAYVYRPSVVRFHQGNDKYPSSAPSFTFQELSVPRRPPWDSSTTPQELERREQQAFLEWRRAIAAHEERLLLTIAHARGLASAGLSVTPFEKNLQVWRQLWRVLERSGCVLQIVDARNPSFYLSKDLQRYVTDELGKPMMVVVNKSDYLTPKQRRVWLRYLLDNGWGSSDDRGGGDVTDDAATSGICFFSAFEEQRKLDLKAQRERRRMEAASSPGLFSDDDDESIKRQHQEEDGSAYAGDAGHVEDDEEEVSEAEAGDPANAKTTNGVSSLRSSDPRTPDHNHDGDSNGYPPLLTRQELIEAMLDFAHRHGCEPDPRYAPTRTTAASDSADDPPSSSCRIPFGLTGFPNVGKSSVINVLMGNSKHTHGTVKVGVAAQPGKTKHFQTLLLPSFPVVLCDCPGLVFPSFVSSTSDLIASGVYPIAQMRDPWPVLELICRRIPRNVLNATYGIRLPPPSTAYSSSSSATILDGGLAPPPTAEELVETYCVARGMLSASSGVPDVHRASRQIVQDYASGKLLYCHAPPTPPPSVSSLSFVMTDEEYQQETLATALRRTDKLRSKLKRQEKLDDPSRPPTSSMSLLASDQKTPWINLEVDPSVEGAASLDVGSVDLVVDDDLRQLLEESSSPATASTRGAQPASHKKHFNKPGRGRGKKGGSSLRDSDPYGCHARQAEADDRMLMDSTRGLGVGVRAGKYSRDAGYTRPNYSGPRGAVAVSTRAESG
jgi:large subunit GTPase 1